MTAVDLLKGCPLFYELYDDEIEAIIKTCDVASFNPTDYILKQGDHGSEIYVILAGSAVVKVNKNGKTSEIAELKKGDVFGELVLINETKRSADIICITPVDCLIINQDTIFSLYKKNTQIFSVLILNLARLLTKRLKMANETIEKIKMISKAA